MTSVLPTYRILTASALAGLATLPDESVHCCVTSPPYWGLRDYGTGRWEGGDAACDHAPTWGHQGETGQRADGVRTTIAPPQKGGCSRCGAVRVDDQIGLERTPQEYVEKIVEVFREVRRVLRDDGTLWLNLGDCYAGSWGAQSRDGTEGGVSASQIVAHPRGQTRTGSLDRTPGLKPKDLVGIPWRTAFALQADGWYLRSDIIWSKPNPMPESVTDRPTKAHEYLFLLAKSERYYYDGDAIAEPSLNAGKTVGYSPDSKNVSTAGDPRFATRIARDVTVKATRNKRSVWTIPTEPFSGAHFAVMPTALAEPCVLAGCPTGGTVLDPFTGTGTTGLVARRHGCHFIGIELKPATVAMAEDRVGGAMPLLNVAGGDHLPRLGGGA